MATAMGRLRAKLKYRPVIFELLPPEFTLTELQRTVEAISGRHLHKQNFRRLVRNRRPGRTNRGDVDTDRRAARPRCFDFAARCCRSGRRPACAYAGGADGVDDLMR